MSESMIAQAIGSTALNLDPDTVRDVASFVRTFLGETSKIDLPKIYACTAIVCECKKMPAVGEPTFVNSGLTIEKIMGNLQGTPKEEFFSLICLVASKWPSCPNALYQKIDLLKASYRIFKKYRKACLDLGHQARLDDLTSRLLSSLAWLVNITAVMKEGDLGSLQQMPHVLPLLLREVYCRYFGLLEDSRITGIVSRLFPQPTVSNQAEERLRQRYQSRYLSIIRQAYESRMGSRQFQQLIHRPDIIERLIDDLSSAYSHERELVYPWFIDEVSYLGLSKTLTPEVFRPSSYQFFGHPITNKIHFEPERFISMDSGHSEGTPLTHILQSLSWIRACVESLSLAQIEEVKEHYERQRSLPYKHFLDLVDGKLEEVIQTCTPSCRNFNQRKTEIFKFFTCCIYTVIKMYSGEDLKRIYSTEESILSILCLCAEIFNFCYQAKVGDYSHYCQMFGISVASGFEPINWFGHFLNLPHAVSEHLFDLERRLLIKEIWESSLGLEIINSKGLSPLDEGRRKKMLKRLEYHVQFRIRDICEEAAGSYNSEKAFKLVQVIMEREPSMISRNKIDQVIICCITAALSLNEEPHLSVIQKIFEQYRKVTLSFESNLLSMVDVHGNSFSIIEFYNTHFIPILDRLVNEGKTGNILQTPKQIHWEDWDAQETDFQLFGFQSHAESVFQRNPREVKLGRREFQRKLVKNIMLSAGKTFSHEESQSSGMLDESEEGPNSGTP